MPGRVKKPTLSKEAGQYAMAIHRLLESFLREDLDRAEAILKDIEAKWDANLRYKFNDEFYQMTYGGD